MRPLRVIAGAALAEGRLLLVSKRAAPSIWYMSVFVVELAGAPAPAAEIFGLQLWPGPDELRLAPAVADTVIPLLREARRL